MTALLFFLRGGKSSSHPSQKGAHLALLFFWSVRRSAPLGPPASLPAHLLRLSEADQGEGKGSRTLRSTGHALRRTGDAEWGGSGHFRSPDSRGGSRSDTLAAKVSGKAAKVSGRGLSPLGSAFFLSDRRPSRVGKSAVQLVREPSPLVRSPSPVLWSSSPPPFPSERDGRLRHLRSLSSPCKGGSCPARAVSPGNGSFHTSQGLHDGRWDRPGLPFEETARRRCTRKGRRLRTGPSLRDGVAVANIELTGISRKHPRNFTIGLGTTVP
jgi:hypothetical protein